MADDQAVGKNSDVLHFGVAPWTEPKLLMAWFQPIKKILDAEYGGSTVLKSAAHLADHVKKSIQGNYDVIQMPAQISFFLMEQYGFKPILIIHGNGHKHTRVLLVSLARNHILTLKNASKFGIAVGSNLTLTTQIAEKWFAESGDVPNFLYVDHQWNILDGIVSGRYQSGAVLAGMLSSLSPVIKNKLHVIKKSDVSVGGLLLARPDFPDSNISALQSVLLNFNGIDRTLLKSAQFPTDKGLAELRESIKPYYDDAVKRIQLNLVNPDS